MLISIKTQPNEVVKLEPQKVNIPIKIKEIKTELKSKFGSKFFIPQQGATDCFRACVSMVKRFNSKLDVVTSKEAHYVVQEVGDSLKILNKDFSIIDKMLKIGLPVIVGVHHTFKYGYNEGTTDHFIVIVRKGWDNLGMYYQFYDVGSKLNGVSIKNKLRLSNGYLIGQREKGPQYVLTQIRRYR